MKVILGGLEEIKEAMNNELLDDRKRQLSTLSLLKEAIIVLLFSAVLICCLEQGHKSHCQPDQIWNTDIRGNLLLRSGNSALTSKGVSGGAVEGAQKVHPQVSKGSRLCQELF